MKSLWVESDNVKSKYEKQAEVAQKELTEYREKIKRERETKREREERKREKKNKKTRKSTEKKNTRKDIYLFAERAILNETQASDLAVVQKGGNVI